MLLVFDLGSRSVPSGADRPAWRRRCSWLAWALLIRLSGLLARGKRNLRPPVALVELSSELIGAAAGVWSRARLGVWPLAILVSGRGSAAAAAAGWWRRVSATCDLRAQRPTGLRRRHAPTRPPPAAATARAGTGLRAAQVGAESR